jgi:hypothetical protein
MRAADHQRKSKCVACGNALKFWDFESSGGSSAEKLGRPQRLSSKEAGRRLNTISRGFGCKSFEPQQCFTPARGGAEEPLNGGTSLDKASKTLKRRRAHSFLRSRLTKLPTETNNF